MIGKDIHRLKVKGWEKSYHSHGPRKQAGVAILISNKINFKPKLIKKDKEGHYILLKGTIHQQDITIINLYAPNNGAATFIKQTLLKFKNQINHNTIIMGDFNTPLSPLDRSSRQKLNKETIELNSTIDNLDLTDIYRIYQPSSSGYTGCSGTRHSPGEYCASSTLPMEALHHLGGGASSVFQVSNIFLLFFFYLS
uniref:exodeoxyribonuclease III n=1 Tax=Spermophilus dauricus TaxID=99837 RepID=A0A8C9QBS4_SPEDA